MNRLIEFIAGEVRNYDGWTICQNSISKRFFFNTHIDAVKFVEAASLESIAKETYPEIRLSFEKVEIVFDFNEEKDVFRSLDLIKSIENFCDCYNLK
ncbi:MAG: 4a-hydroxytetrahydrobiopterin dehydratase [Acidobacteria bacterium]|nr:4a-hydroxytetrahydrobiopterin dehydratase [Acidobacteriota bacterium]